MSCPIPARSARQPNSIPFAEALRHKASLRAYAIRCTRSLGLGHLYDIDELLQALWLRALERWDGPSGPRDPHPRAIRSWLHRMLLRYMQTEGITNQRRRRILSVKRMDVMEHLHGADADAAPTRTAGDPDSYREHLREIGRDKRYLLCTDGATHPKHNAGSRACHDPREALAAKIDADRALAALGPESRALLVAAHAGGDTPRELARDLGIASSALASRLERGRLVAAAALGIAPSTPGEEVAPCPRAARISI